MTDPRRDWPLEPLEDERQRREQLARRLSLARAWWLYRALCERYGLEGVELEADECSDCSAE